MSTNGTSTDTTNHAEKNDLVVPQWIDAEYFKEILALDGKSKWKYISHDVQMANGKGENYVAVLYRVKVMAENEENITKELSYILKVNHILDGPTKEMMDIFNVFEKEVEMYRSVVPGFENLLQESGDFTQFAPKCLKTSTPTTEQIVLEDLSEKGFKMASRHEGLDWDHVKLVIERLSKFHAASAVFHERNGAFSDLLLNGMYNDKLKPMMETYFNTNLAILKENIGKFDDGKRFLEQMENYEEKSFDKCKDVTRADPNDFNVLNHGDLWTNNLMFKYNSKDKVEDMLFIDLQLSVWGSPAVDLHYFIVSSAERKLKTAEFDTIIQHYHDNLVKSLKQLGYGKRIPTLMELQIDLLQRGYLGVMASISVLPLTLLTDCADADLNNMLDEGDAGMNLKRKLYGNPPYLSIMEMLFGYYAKKGILQI